MVDKIIDVSTTDDMKITHYIFGKTITRLKRDFYRLIILGRNKIICGFCGATLLDIQSIFLVKSNLTKISK